MKKISAIILIGVMCIILSSQAFAMSYNFESGEDTLSGFGKATSNDNPVTPDPMSQNERRNKDSALFPPPYFYGSGDIPTDPSSLYHDNQPGDVSGNFSSIPGSYGVMGGTLPPVSGFETSTSVTPVYTAPKYYPDGSIGTIYVERTRLTIKIYEGENLENLKRGAGHFSSTSAWDGNVGLCGHNRGSWPYFAFVKDMQIGDRITYTTLYGTRTFEVYSKEQISEYDHSKLGWTANNILSLFTCIADVPQLRWAVQCKEVN